jgi:5-methyltetrahydrofolate--homocysteine methyltransferase
MASFLEILRSGRVLLMDGAMGTELQRAGIGENECYEAWNLTHPEKVCAIHQAYVDAGAEVLLTNTFQANPIALAKHGLETQLEAIHHAAISLAGSVTAFRATLLVDVGPIPTELRADWNGIREWSKRVLSSSRSADGTLLETYSGWMVQTAVRDLREQRGDFKHTREMPVMLSLAFDRPHSGFFGTLDGQELETLADWSNSSGIAALGVNCGREIGMDEIIEIIRRYRQVTDMPLFARPNAGTPTRAGDRWVYPLTPEKMAERLPELLEAGVNLVGGCCGTTPEHIAAMRPIIDAWNAKRGFGPVQKAW